VKFPRHRSNLHFDKKMAEITTDESKLNRGIKPSDLAIAPPENTPVMCAH
jgi:hypothetical protein